MTTTGAAEKALHPGQAGSNLSRLRTSLGSVYQLRSDPRTQELGNSATPAGFIDLKLFLNMVRLRPVQRGKSCGGDLS